MGAQNIYNILRNGGLSRNGALAMMGNMQAESALRANNAQDGMTSMTDEQYTAAVDKGQMSAYAFAHDSVGYGLCQWTWYGRKANLLAFATRQHTSIGDESMQAEFCIKELKSDFYSLYNYLCGDCDLYTAVSRICKEFEKPAINNIDVRFSNAQSIANQVSDSSNSNTSGGNTGQTSNNQSTNIGQSIAHKIGKSSTELLKERLTNDDVKTLQIFLNGYGYTDYEKKRLVVDGYIGKRTAYALAQFSKDITAIT